MAATKPAKMRRKTKRFLSLKAALGENWPSNRGPERKVYNFNKDCYWIVRDVLDALGTPVGLIEIKNPTSGWSTKPECEGADLSARPCVMAAVIGGSGVYTTTPGVSTTTWPTITASTTATSGSFSIKVAGSSTPVMMTKEQVADMADRIAKTIGGPPESKPPL